MSATAVQMEVAGSAFDQAANEGKSAGQRFLTRLDADSPPDALFAKVANYYDPADEDHLQPRLRGLSSPGPARPRRARCEVSAAIADAVEANIEGQKAAKAVLAQIAKGTAPPDALEYALRAVHTSWGRPGMTGACRIVQKALEAI